MVIRTLRRYALSLGHGALTIAVGTIVFTLPRDLMTGLSIIAGLVAAQACLIALWMALADRHWWTRCIYGALHMAGLMFCVLAAGQMHLDLGWSRFETMEILRDVPAIFLASGGVALLLRWRGWRLSDGLSPIGAGTEPSAPGKQFSLGDFGKWFTLLCIALGLGVSLIVPSYHLANDRLHTMRSLDYLGFALIVWIPAAALASVFFWGALRGRDNRTVAMVTAGIIWVCTNAALSAVAAVMGALAPSMLYLVRHDWHVLPAFAGWVLVAMVSAYGAGWRIDRDGLRPKP